MKQSSTTKSCESGQSRELKKFVLAAIEEFEAPLTRYAQRMFGSTSQDDLEEARDAVQHTFLKLCEQPVESVAPKIGPWLYAVCRNRVIDQMRRMGKVSEKWPPPFELSDGALGPHQQAEQAEFSERLANLIGQLSGMEREVIELWSQGFNHKEIADVIEKSPAAIRVGLHRGLKKLKNHPEVRSWLERATSHARQEDPVASNNGKLASQPASHVGNFEKQSALTQPKGEQS